MEDISTIAQDTVQVIASAVKYRLHVHVLCTEALHPCCVHALALHRNGLSVEAAGQALAMMNSLYLTTVCSATALLYGTRQHSAAWQHCYMLSCTL
eukprot:17589-Heterococcus_DN1.PRE.2